MQPRARINVRMRLPWLAIASLALALAVTGCGGSSTASTGGTTPTPTPTTAPTAAPTVAPTPTPTIPANAKIVHVVDFAFTPSSLTIKKGTTVVWTNDSNTAHTVTSDTGDAMSFGGPLPSQGSTVVVTFSSTGMFSYHCAIHPTRMTGVIIVTS